MSCELSQMFSIKYRKIHIFFSYPSQKRPYNTHMSPWHFIMAEAAELYHVLSIILIP